jgi:hypothetical protein
VRFLVKRGGGAAVWQMRQISDAAKEMRDVAEKIESATE